MGQPRAGRGRPDRLGLRVAAVAASLLVAAACSSDEDGFRFVRLEGRMPAIEGDTLAGGRLAPSDYRGKIVLVNFWASWCGPCRREQPGLQALWRELQPTGRFAFIGVNYKDRGDAAREWIRRYRVTYATIADPQGDLAERFSVPFLPTTILADASGDLRFRLVGEQRPDELERLLTEIAEP